MDELVVFEFEGPELEEQVHVLGGLHILKGVVCRDGMLKLVVVWELNQYGETRVKSNIV